MRLAASARTFPSTVTSILSSGRSREVCGSVTPVDHGYGIPSGAGVCRRPRPRQICVRLRRADRRARERPHAARIRAWIPVLPTLRWRRRHGLTVFGPDERRLASSGVHLTRWERIKCLPILYFVMPYWLNLAQVADGGADVASSADEGSMCARRRAELARGRPRVRILVVGYHFPPIGGRRRNAFCTSVDSCVSPGTRCASSPAAGARTIRGLRRTTRRRPRRRARGGAPGATDPTPRTGVGRGLERLLALPTRFEAWFTLELRAIPARLPWRPDVILGELVPYGCAPGAVELARALDAPLVVDLHDPWALDEMWLYPSWAQRVVDRRRMRRTLAAAAAVVMNTPEAARRVRQAFPSVADRVVAIPSGYDRADFPRDTAGSERRSETFKIVHTGSMHVDQGRRHAKTQRLRQRLGGMPVPGTTFTSRSHTFLVQAVRALTRSDPELARELELHFAGPATNSDREVAQGIAGVHWHGYLAHEDTVRLIRTSNLLFLPMHDVPGRAGLVPTKTYEYLGSGRPILAAVPPGDARDLLTAAGTAAICNPTDAAGLADALREAVDGWRAGRVPPEPDWSVVDAIRVEAHRPRDGRAPRADRNGAPNRPSVTAAATGCSSPGRNPRRLCAGGLEAVSQSAPRARAPRGGVRPRI